MYSIPLYIINPNEAMSLPQALLVAVVGIAVVLAELALLSVFILILSKIFAAFFKKKQTAAENAPEPVAVAEAPAPAGVPLPDNESEGSVNLVNVDEPTAACIMAIVSRESGIPLNRLSFKSIKLLEDK